MTFPPGTSGQIWHHRNGFRLELHPSPRAPQGPLTWLSYRFLDKAWATATTSDPVIFTGDDLGILPSPTVPDSINHDWTTHDTDHPATAAFASAVQALDAFFAQLPGTIDEGYFSHYTTRQLTWRDARAHLLAHPAPPVPASPWPKHP